MTSGPIVIGRRGPVRCASWPMRADSVSISTVIGRSDAPGLDRRVAEAQLELEHDEERGAAEGGVHRERREVGPGELP